MGAYSTSAYSAAYDSAVLVRAAPSARTFPIRHDDREPLMVPFPKDPHSFLDFTFDWSSWLTSPEKISGVEIIVEGGLELEEVEFENGLVNVWVSGGIYGRIGRITCRVTTDHTPHARQDDRTIEIPIRNL